MSIWPFGFVLAGCLWLIDYTQTVQHRVSGRIVHTLNLGFDGYLEIKAFADPSDLGDSTKFLNILKQYGVYRCLKDDCNCTIKDSEEGTIAIRALNIRSAWHGPSASIIILAPTVLSLAIAIVWPIVAVRSYHADVQLSVQTASNVASYVVTAGKWLKTFSL